MAEASIPVDLFNPGQVFACLGLVELVLQLQGSAEGTFDWSEPGRERFWLRSEGEESPIALALAFLDNAEAVAEAPLGSACLDSWKSAWGREPESTAPESGYPFPEPPSPATLVCTLRRGQQRVVLDYWGDATERDNTKFWAGAGGYPGAALARDALDLIRGRAAAAASDPFALSAPQSSSFRLDWRRDYIPIDTGFSLNAHANMATLGFPLVELLGAIGLENARPRRREPRNKLAYLYGVVGRDERHDRTYLPPSILRAGLGAIDLPFPSRRFLMKLDWPGQENQARSITTVTEEVT